MHGSLVPALFALAAFASVPVASAHPVLAPSFAPRVAFDEGDEESAFIAGLAERGLHEMVVREATKFLDRRARHPRAAAVRYRRASARYELGAFDESLADYRALDRVDGFEQAAEVDFRIGQCSLELGKNEEAAAAFADVRKGDADYLHVPASYLLGEALFRSGSFDEARAAYASVLKAEGKEAAEYAADARYGVVWSAWKAREIEAAVAGASEFVARHGDDPRTGEV
ncbi:MAG: tetratricopeptide repeat protein, partial [Planctomycetota bacterium]